MRYARTFSAAWFFLAAAARAEGPRPATSNALNPRISVVGDFTAAAGPRSDAASGRAALREAEFAFQANVDPYARADFYVAVPDGESAEIEEGYVTLLSLPWGLQARGGRIKALFGRMNAVHGHERPQVDSPFAVDRFLGEEGLAETGAEVSRLFAPFGVFTELSYALLNGLGGEEAPGETVTVPVVDGAGNPVLDGNGNPVVKEVALAGEDPQRPRTLRNFAHAARARFYGDLTEAANLDVGLSGVLSQPAEDRHVTMAALDVTFRWRPPQQGLYRGFLWRTEGFYSHRVLPETLDLTGAVTAPRRRLDRLGAYSYAEIQPARRWRFGVRGDYSEDPEAKDALFGLPGGGVRRVRKSVERGVSPYATFALTEFNRLRLQVQHKSVPSGETERRAWLQWTVVLGPHGAHPF